MRRELNITRDRLSSSTRFAQTARANDLPSRRETLKQLVTKRPSLLFAGFNQLDCFANVKSSEADFALRGGAVERRNNNDNYYYKFAQDVRVRRKSLTLIWYRAELTSAWSSRTT